MNPSARPLALLLTALLALCLFGAGPASASRRAHASTGPRVGIGTARIAKRGKLQRVRASHRRKAAAANSAAANSLPVQNPEVLFDGNFDSGFSGWHVQSLSYRATLVSSAVFQGTLAGRFEVQSGDVEPETGSQRSEVSGPTFDEGQDLYIRDAVRIPSGNTFQGPWQIIQQLHEEDWDGSPGIAVFLDSERTLTLGPGDSSRTLWDSAPLQSDRWYDLVYRVKLSQDPGTGFVEVWLDGVQQRLDNGQTRIYAQTMQMPQTYLKAGIYRSRSSSGTSVVEHDAIAVGSSYAAVTAD